MTKTLAELIARVAALPEEALHEVADFVEELEQQPDILQLGGDTLAAVEEGSRKGGAGSS
jgi:hypothetical protein